MFTSPLPQGWDPGAEKLGAFFGRFLIAVDYAPGFDARAAQVDPVARYASFLADAMARYRASAQLRAQQPDLWALLQAEERRLRANHPSEWADGEALRNDATG